MICWSEADASAASYLCVRNVAESLKRRMAFFLSDFSSFILNFANVLFRCCQQEELGFFELILYVVYVIQLNFYFLNEYSVVGQLGGCK